MRSCSPSVLEGSPSGSSSMCTGTPATARTTSAASSARARLRAEVTTTQRLTSRRSRTCARLLPRIPSPSSSRPPWISARRTSAPGGRRLVAGRVRSGRSSSMMEPGGIDPGSCEVVRRIGCQVVGDEPADVTPNPGVLPPSGAQALDQLVRRNVEPDHVPAAVQPRTDGRVRHDEVGGNDPAECRPRVGLVGTRRPITESARRPGSPVRSAKRAPWRSASARPTIRAPHPGAPTRTISMSGNYAVSGRPCAADLTYDTT